MKSLNFTKAILLIATIFAVSRIPSTLTADPAEEPLSNIHVPVTQECFLGEMKMFAGNYTPRNWMPCDGRLLTISQNSALFSILGTIYGGDGRVEFALPDLRGRVPVGEGTGAGLTNQNLGQKTGTETQTLSVNQLPAHNHSGTVTINAGGVPAAKSNRDATNVADGNILAGAGRVHGGIPNIYSQEGASGTLGADAASVTLNNTGGGQSFNIMQPSLGVNYIICVQGTFPTRD